MYITYNNTECLPVSRLMYIYGNPEKNVQHPEIKGETEIKVSHLFIDRVKVLKLAGQ